MVTFWMFGSTIGEVLLMGLAHFSGLRGDLWLVDAALAGGAAGFIVGGWVYDSNFVTDESMRGGRREAG